MGNSQSSTDRIPSSPLQHQHDSTSQSHARGRGTASSTATHRDHHQHHQHNQQQKLPRTPSRGEPRRRDSIPVLAGVVSSSGSGKAAPAPPTSTTATAEHFKPSHTYSASSGARLTSSSLQAPDYTRLHAPIESGHRRRQSAQASSRSDLLPADHTGMGNEHSKPAREATDAAPSSRARKATTSLQPPPEPVVGPVDVPHGQQGEHGNFDDTLLAVDQPYSLPPSAGFSRPPRLPLPIEEEEYTPGSPVISPQDLEEAVEPLGQEAAGVPRSRSMLSGTTVDDDEVDEETQSGLVGEGFGPSVPTVIEWQGPGEKVYVTGTFAAWDRKYRLHKDGPSKHKGALSATINLQPGTHHLKFIVDGDMRLSDNLPTAVDFTNILVNYIEVSPDDRVAHHPAVRALGAPVIAPGTEPIAIKSQQGATATQTVGAPDQKSKLPSHVKPPQVITPTQDLGVDSPRSSSQPKTDQSDKPPTRPSSKTAAQEHPEGRRMATKYYHNVVPHFLLDLDSHENSEARRRADAVSDTLPTPPTLPLFLSKSVLNGAMPMKDDASVLIMPNHTVLNHLATSSIRQGVLATSATTRYKQKFLTTIIYKPTGDVGE